MFYAIPISRTLEYLMLHLNKMTIYAENTGMTAQNMAIVWAPNLIRCRDLEGGNVAEFKVYSFLLFLNHSWNVKC